MAGDHTGIAGQRQRCRVERLSDQFSGAVLKQFVPLQRQLAKNDALNEYIKHTSSGVWACPPGVAPGEYWGQALFT